MTKLLINLFVKDRENVTDPTVRRRYAMLASITGELCKKPAGYSDL